MKPDKILYVDDEPMALKYFERLISPMAPVLTALSVEEGKMLLDQRAGEIVILVSDQHMPGAWGNELLSYARERHPRIVRMLTTAYSELGLAIEAINSGEIYRYITKPWDIASLQADLKNALELADLRSERDGLLSEKMLIQQHQLMAQRVSQLPVMCAGFVGKDCDESLYTYLGGAVQVGCRPPEINWQVLDHSDLMQAEALREIAIGRELAKWHAGFGEDRSPVAAATALAKALPQQSFLDGTRVRVLRPQLLYGVLAGTTNEELPPDAIAWLAWLTWFGDHVKLTADGEGWEVDVEAARPSSTLSKHWLASYIDRLAQPLT